MRSRKCGLTTTFRLRRTRGTRWKLCHPGQAVSQHERLRGCVFFPRPRPLCRSSSARSRRRVDAPIESMRTEGKKRVVPKMRSAYADGVRCQSTAARAAADAARIDRPASVLCGGRREKRVARDGSRADFGRGPNGFTGHLGAVWFSTDRGIQ